MTATGDGTHATQSAADGSKSGGFALHADASSSAAVGVGRAAAGNPLQLQLRPLQPEDEGTVLAMWLEGWDETLAAMAPAFWAKATRFVARFAAAAALAALVCFCAASLPLWRNGGGGGDAAGGGGGSSSSYAVLLSYGTTCCGAAAAVLSAAAAAAWATPTRVRLAVLRLPLHLLIQRMCPDMWAMYGVWGMGASRQYWVAVEAGSGQVVAGVGLRYGSALRPALQQQRQQQQQQQASDLGYNAKAIEAAEERARRLGPPPPEDAAGFSEFEARAHGQLSPSDAILSRMVTDARMRRKGVGRQLIEHAAQSAAAIGAVRLLLVTANPGAKSFYRACGFDVEPAAAGHGGGGAFVRVLRAGAGGAGSGKEAHEGK